MTSQISILIYGHDTRLLETRQMVLERAGYWVSRTTQLTSVAQLIPIEQVDLLILCHTLTLEDCGRAVAVVNSRWPHVQTLVLSAGNKGCARTAPDIVLDTFEGPAKLLNTVSRLVHPEPGVSLMH